LAERNIDLSHKMAEHIAVEKHMGCYKLANLVDKVDIAVSEHIDFDIGKVFYNFHNIDLA
jgi:hypothetical protein